LATAQIGYWMALLAPSGNKQDRPWRNPGRRPAATENGHRINELEKSAGSCRRCGTLPRPYFTEIALRPRSPSVISFHLSDFHKVFSSGMGCAVACLAGHEARHTEFHEPRSY